MNPHELALTRPSTYEGLSGECGVVPFEHASCGCTFGVVGPVRVEGPWFVTKFVTKGPHSVP